MSNKNFDDIEEQIIDIDEMQGTDIKINPDFYIHKALLKAQDALSSDNLKEGFIKYRQFIEHIEVLCSSAEIIPHDYYDKINEYKQSKEFLNLSEQAKSPAIANKKLKLMMVAVFQSKTQTNPLKLK